MTSCAQREPAPNKFSDTSLLTIAKLQDERNGHLLIPFLKAKKPVHRLAALNALASIRDTSLQTFLFVTLYTDQITEVRSSAAYAIGQLRDSSCVARLFKALEMEIQASVQKQVLIALSKCANMKVLKFLAEFDENNSALREGHAIGLMHIARSPNLLKDHVKSGLRYLRDVDNSDECRFYSAFALARMNKELTAGICDSIALDLESEKNEDLKIALRRLCTSSEPAILSPFLLDELKQMEDKPYVFASQLAEIDLSSSRALSYLTFIAKNARHQVSRTAATEQYFKQLPRPIVDADAYRSFITYALNSRDMALQSHAALELKSIEDTANYAEFIPLLKEQIKLLAMPRQTETYIDMVKALSHVSGEPEIDIPTSTSHKVNWKEVEQIPHDQKITIKTSKGDIVLMLFVEDAPGSVWNFLNSVKAGEYNGRFFHRVVPDFVIQGGCPRGDGWGGPDWTQRSEFSQTRPFVKGAFGLASSGNDTEGVQFFITHCATPQLDGRYTVFGQVLTGFDVVDEIVVGDKIISIELNETADPKA